MLGRHVPRGGSRVLDLGIREGRNLYYYPKDVLQVVALTPSPDVQLLESQAAKAMVPIDIIRKPPDASGLPSNSMDAVVSVYGMAELSDTQIASVLRETVRVLKPGKPFIFIENVGSKGMPLRTSQKVMESVARVFGNRSVATRDLLPYIQETDGLEDMQYEMVLDFQDPHIVGLATKNPVNSAPVRISKDKGFKKNKQ